jgi:biotin-dependent carboxylase-like uncharacterized protein
MTPRLTIRRAGPACSVQDEGRHGYLRFGVTPAGPMDWIGHRTANLLAGNSAGAAAIEAGPSGLGLEAAEAPLRLGICAPGFRVERDGSALPTRLSIVLRPGERLSIVPGRFGVWGYVAPEGGFDAEPVMGSLSTHVRSALGPFGGTGLAAGMTIPLRHAAADDAAFAIFEPAIPPYGPIRFVPGPQDDHFTAEARAAFAEGEYEIAARSDRMAWRLSGPPLAHAKGHDIVSDGIALGAIQVPGDGQPLVLMADRQPTGGYPKIGTVARADLPVLAQMRPGQKVRFRPVTVEAAVDALRAAIPDERDIRSRYRRLTTISWT